MDHTVPMPDLPLTRSSWISSKNTTGRTPRSDAASSRRRSVTARSVSASPAVAPSTVLVFSAFAESFPTSPGILSSAPTSLRVSCRPFALPMFATPFPSRGKAWAKASISLSMIDRTTGPAVRSAGIGWILTQRRGTRFTRA